MRFIKYMASAICLVCGVILIFGLFVDDKLQELKAREVVIAMVICSSMVITGFLGMKHDIEQGE